MFFPEVDRITEPHVTYSGTEGWFRMDRRVNIKPANKPSRGFLLNTCQTKWELNNETSCAFPALSSYFVDGLGGGADDIGFAQGRR